MEPAARRRRHRLRRLVTFAQAFAGALPFAVSAVTAALGVAIALLTGVQRIWKYDETWVAYRRASEQMKREYRLYINGAGPYVDLADEDETYRRFVENTEGIIAEEQQIYWQMHLCASAPCFVGAICSPRPRGGAIG